MKKIFLLLLVVSLSSCGKLFFATYNKTDPFKNKAVWAKEDKEIIHIPMIHIAKQEFYDKVKTFVAQKRKEGFIVYYEGVTAGTENKKELDTLLLKFRKILGFNLKGAYNNAENKSTPKFFKKYTAQRLSNTGVDTLVDVRTDMTIKQLVEKLETQIKAKILLDSCDYSTPLNDKYKCKNYRKKYYFSVVRSYRDAHLKEKLLKAPHSKIILLYGENHKWFLYPDLYKAGFKLKEGKWYFGK